MMRARGSGRSTGALRRRLGRGASGVRTRSWGAGVRRSARLQLWLQFARVSPGRRRSHQGSDQRVRTLMNVPGRRWCCLVMRRSGLGDRLHRRAAGRRYADSHVDLGPRIGPRTAVAWCQERPVQHPCARLCPWPPGMWVGASQLWIRRFASPWSGRRPLPAFRMAAFLTPPSVVQAAWQRGGPTREAMEERLRGLGASGGTLLDVE